MARKSKSRNGDRDVRAFAAGETIEVPVDGKIKEYTVRPLVARHLCDLEKAALSVYKKQYIQTIKDGMDAGLIDSSQALAELQKTASWTVDDLPQMTTYNVITLQITEELREYIHKNMSLEGLSDSDGVDYDNDFYRAVIGSSLDAGSLKAEDIEDIIGTKIPIVKVRYDQWWVTAQIDGMLHFVLTSINYDSPEVTIDQVASWPIPKLQEVARVIENLTAAAMGNT